MLPTSHYGRGHGRGGRGGSAATLPVLVASLVLAAICGIGYYSAHRKASNLQKELKAMQGTHNHVEEQLNHQRSIYQHMEYEYHTCQRKINDMTREVQQKDHMLQLRTQEKESCFMSESQLQEVVKQLQEQVTYEKAIVEAHIGKVAQLEKAHNMRENDWQELSRTWAKFEADATKENTRLLLELAKATQAAGGAQPAAVPPVVPQPLPDQIPKTRPESEFNTNVNIPKEEDYVHHLKRAEEYLKAQQQKLQHPGIARETQPEVHASESVPDHSAGLHGGERRLATDGLDKDPHGTAFDPAHTAPSPYGHTHHEHAYEDPNHWVDDTPEHIDPLDHYWVHDQPWDNDHAHWDHNAHHDAYHFNDPAHHSPPPAHQDPPAHHDSYHSPPAHHDAYHNPQFHDDALHKGGHDLNQGQGAPQHQYDSGGHGAQRQAQEHHTMQDWQTQGGGQQQQHRPAAQHSQQDWQAQGGGAQHGQHDWQTQQAQRDWDAQHAARQAQQAGDVGRQHDERQAHAGQRNPNLLPRHGLA